MEINPEIVVSGEKKQYIDLTGRERENIAFNSLIATGYNIISELQIVDYIKTSIEDAEIDINVDDLLRERIFRNSTINELLAELVENTEGIAFGVND